MTVAQILDQGKNLPAMQTCKRPGFDPWVRKIPWRRKWQPAPVILSGKSHGQRSLAGYSPRGRKELDTTQRLNNTPKSQYCTTTGTSPGQLGSWEKAYLITLPKQNVNWNAISGEMFICRFQKCSICVCPLGSDFLFSLLEAIQNFNFE